MHKRVASPRSTEIDGRSTEVSRGSSGAADVNGLGGIDGAKWADTRSRHSFRQDGGGGPHDDWGRQMQLDEHALFYLPPLTRTILLSYTVTHHR